MTTATTMPEWKQNLRQAKTLRGESGLLAFQVATILTTVYKDPKWWLEANIRTEDQANRELTEYSNFGEFKRLKMLLERFPDKEIWSQRSLGAIEAMCREQMENEAREEERQKKRRREIEKEKRSLTPGAGTGVPPSILSKPTTPTTINPMVLEPLEVKPTRPSTVVSAVAYETECKRRLEAETALQAAREENAQLRQENYKLTIQVRDLKAQLSRGNDNRPLPPSASASAS